MSLEHQLTAALKETYQKSGEETGYWAHRFLQALNRKGGVFTAKRMLQPRTQAQRAGLDRMLKAGRPDLTLEKVILQPRFEKLFTAQELDIAFNRISDSFRAPTKPRANSPRLYPDDAEPDQQYFEGELKIVRVNAYERDPRARAACLEHWGTQSRYANWILKNDMVKSGRASFTGLAQTSVL